MPNQPHYRVHLFELGQTLFPDKARELTAQLLDVLPIERSVVQQFLHYGNKDPLPGFAPVKFCSAVNGFRLVGFGEAGIELVREVAPQLALAWSRAVKRPVRQRVWEGECALERKPFEIQLQVHKLVIQKRPEHLERFRADPPSHLTGLITRSLERQIAAIGLREAVPVVRVLDYQGEFSAQLGKGNAQFRGVKNVRFVVPAKLTGLWSLGYLTSNGYGLCDANLCNADTVYQRVRGKLDAMA